MRAFTRRAFLGGSLAGLAALAPRNLLQHPHPPARPAPDPDTLFLTWQRDPTTTMTVQWVGPARTPAEATVSYAPAAAKNPVLATTDAAAGSYPLAGMKVYRAELTGLTPGTDYLFHVGVTATAYRFRTMPAKATDTIHFVSGGDCGTDAHAVANNVNAARQDPMFAVLGGDLAYENGRSAPTHLAFLRNYSKHMVGRAGRLIPMVPCIGNHEVDGNGVGKREKAPFFYALFGGLFRDTTYTTLDFGDYLSLVLLDSGHTAAVGGAQADWLERQLKARADHPHVIAVNHIPAYPSAREMVGEKGKEGTGEPNRKYWVPLFEKYRVPVVLEHHDHTFKRTKPLLNGLAHDDGVLYLGDGSWGKLRAPNKPEKLTHLAAVNKEYHLSLHRLEGAHRFHMALAEGGRVMDVCQTGQRRVGLVGAG